MLLRLNDGETVTVTANHTNNGQATTISNRGGELCGRHFGETEVLSDLKKAISLLNRWMDNPDEDKILCDTYHFVCNNELSASKDLNTVANQQ